MGYVLMEAQRKHEVLSSTLSIPPVNISMPRPSFIACQCVLLFTVTQSRPAADIKAQSKYVGKLFQPLVLFNLVIQGPVCVCVGRCKQDALPFPVWPAQTPPNLPLRHRSDQTSWRRSQSSFGELDTKTNSKINTTQHENNMSHWIDPDKGKELKSWVSHYMETYNLLTWPPHTQWCNMKQFKWSF